MADGRKNPLIGAFRTPVAETPPKASEPSKADESKKSAAPPKITVDTKPPVTDQADDKPLSALRSTMYHDGTDRIF